MLTQFLSPGDGVVMAAAVRELHLAHPYLRLSVQTAYDALFEYAPWLKGSARGETIRVDYDSDRLFPAAYATINQSSQRPVHVLEATCEDLSLKLDLPPLRPRHWLDPAILLSPQEKSWYSQVEERTGDRRPFWIISAGGKHDFTNKVWPYFQEVIAARPDIRWVQVGRSTDYRHAPLEGAMDLIDQTDLRQLVRLVYHAAGIVCGNSLLMHLAHWVERPAEAQGRRRPCVVVAGGREPPSWFAYPGHQVLHTIGGLDCCASGGCWRSRVEPLLDGQETDLSLCSRPEDGFPACMRRITAADVLSAVGRYE